MPSLSLPSLLLALFFSLAGTPAPILDRTQGRAVDGAVTRRCSNLPCECSAGGSNFTIHSNGTVTGRTGSASFAGLTLPVPRGFEVNWVFHAAVGSDLLLAYELEDAESGTSRVVRIGVERGRMVLRWTLEISAFNLSQGAFDDRYLYQAAIGVVAKVDVERGEFVWKHEGLYDRERFSFGSFRLPVVTGSEVLFIDSPSPGRQQRTIRVDRQTGAMRIE